MMKIILNQINKISEMIDLAASITSSTITTALLYPIERLKIQMQLNKEDGSVVTNSHNIIERQGIPGFYQGISPLVIGNCISYGIYFVTYEKLKILLQTDSKSIVSIIQSSGLARGYQFCFYESFLCSTDEAIQGNKGLGQILLKMIKKQGFLSLWKGILASLILVTNPIIQFAVYEWLKKHLSKNGQQLSSLIIFVIGAISKIMATIVTYPYTLLRTRQQMKADRNISLAEVYKSIMDNQGFQGLFKGLKPKLIQTTLNAALMLMIYEKVRSVLNNKFG